MKETGGDHLVVLADPTRPDGVAAIVDACRTHLGTVDVLVTGGADPDATPLGGLTPARWQRALDALTAAAFVTQGVQPLLSGRSSVVHVGALGATGTTAGSAARAGLAGLTRSLAHELGPTGVRVNLVAAGSRTTAEQVADVVLFLASAEAAGVTGEIVVVDGAE